MPYFLSSKVLTFLSLLQLEKCIPLIFYIIKGIKKTESGDLAYQRFQQAQTPLERRQAIQILRSGFFDAGLGDEYALPTANPGTYALMLRVDEQVHTGTLSVRADPLTTSQGSF